MAEYVFLKPIRKGAFCAVVVVCVILVAPVLIPSAGTYLMSQTEASQAPAPQTTPVRPTLSLGEVLRTARLEADNPEIRYQNGFFINADITGHILIRDKDGRIRGDFNLHPPAKETATISPGAHDVAVFKDGSIVASWIFMLPHDPHRYHYLVHYDPKGNFLESIDMGQWRALKVCVADDKSIWTLSGKDEFGYEVYSPDEGVLRNYRFGSGFLRAGVPRSNFPHNEGQYTYALKNGNIAMDCSGTKIHVLTGLSQWIEYTPGADFTITNIDPFSHSTFGDDWHLIGFAYLEGGHAYAVIHSVPGNPFRRMFAELLPSMDGKALRWVEIPNEKTLPSNSQPSDPATHPEDRPKEPIMVTGVLGTDHEDGEQLVYRTSADEAVHWSKPLFDSPATQTDSIPQAAGVSVLR